MMFDAGKTRMIGLPCGEKNYDNMLRRFHFIPERHRQTDERSESDIIAILIAPLAQCAAAGQVQARHHDAPLSTQLCSPVPL